MIMAPTIRGTLELPSIGRLDVRVSLDDVTMQDAAAVVIAETRLSAVENRAAFVLEVPEGLVGPTRTYTLAAQACSPGEAKPRAGTVAVHRWMPGDESPQTIEVRDFHSFRGDVA
jgi:hypothetical protein